MSREQQVSERALQGAAAGSAAGPWGAAIGAGLGGLMGYLGSQDQERRAKKAHEENERNKALRNRYAVFYGQRPDQMMSRVSRSPIPATISGMTQGADFGAQMGNLYAKSKKSPDREPYLENVDYGRIDSPPPSQSNYYDPNPEYGPLNPRRTMYA